MSDVDRTVSSLFRDDIKETGNIVELPEDTTPDTPVRHHNNLTGLQGGTPYIHLSEGKSVSLTDLINSAGYSTPILVDQRFPVDIEGMVYQTLEAAIEWCQVDASNDTPSLEEYTVHIGPGEYLIKKSIIMNVVPVRIIGSGKGSTILRFDRTDESADNYWIRTSTSGTVELAPRICFAYCDYTDQTTYGLVDNHSWDGNIEIRDLTIQLEYSGDNTSSSALLPIYSSPDNGNVSIDISDIEIRTFGNPQRVEASANNTYCIYHSNNATALTNEKPFVSIRNCTFKGTRLMTGTVSITSGTNALAGTSTLFLTELSVGQYIEIDDRTYAIATIVDDDTATITGTADATHSGEPAVAINPLSNAILIDDQNLQKKVDVSVVNCSFVWVSDQVVHLEDCDTTIQNVYIENCATHDLGHSVGAYDSAMISTESGRISIINTRVVIRSHVEKIATNDWRMVLGCNITKSYLEQFYCEEKDTTTFTYYSFFETNEQVRASNCQLGSEVVFGESWCVKLNSDRCNDSQFVNCAFYGKTGVSSSLSSSKAIGVKAINCYFHREVRFDVTAEKFNAVNCEFNETFVLANDYSRMVNCTYNAAVTLTGGKHNYTQCLFEDDVTIDGDDNNFASCDFLEALTVNSGSYDNSFDSFCSWVVGKTITLPGNHRTYFERKPLYQSAGGVIVIGSTNNWFTDIDFNLTTVDKTCDLPELQYSYGRTLRISLVGSTTAKVTVRCVGTDTFLAGDTEIELLDVADTLVVSHSPLGWKVQ